MVVVVVDAAVEAADEEEGPVVVVLVVEEGTVDGLDELGGRELEVDVEVGSAEVPDELEERDVVAKEEVDEELSDRDVEELDPKTDVAVVELCIVAIKVVDVVELEPRVVVPEVAKVDVDGVGPQI